MTPIMSAMLSGYGPDQILDYVVKAMPKLAPRVKQARNAGYPAANIVDFLSKAMESTPYDPSMTQSQIHGINAKKQEQITKQLLKMGSSIGAGYAAGRQLPNIIQGVKGLFGGAKTPPSAQLPQTQLGQVGPQPVPPPGPQPGPPPLPNQGPLQAAGPSAIPINAPPGSTVLPQPSPELANSSIAALEEMGIGPQIQNLQSAGNTDEQISAALGAMLKPHQKKWYNEKVKTGEVKPLEQAIKDYVSQAPIQANKKEEVKPIGKGSQVITPDGEIGQIHDIKKNSALLNIDGKIHVVKTEGLENAPKEWEQITVDLSKIPEEQRSAPLNMVAASDSGKFLATRFWEFGDKEHSLYIYERKDGKPIDDEVLHSIQEETDAPVTNGMEFTGMWRTKGKSRGSAFHHRIKMLSQSAEDEDVEDDPNKPFVFYRLPIKYEHGIMKAIFGKLKEAREKFNAVYKPKKNKKPNK